MGLTDIINAIVDPILSPFLHLPPVLSIILLAFILSLAITLVYKYTTNQNEMRILKDELKKGREKIKSAKGKPEKQMEIQKGLLKVQHKYMMQSMRATLFTFIPIIIILGWMQAEYSVVPFEPDETVMVTAEFVEGTLGDATLSSPGVLNLNGATQQIENGVAVWEISASEAGEYELNISTASQMVSHTLLVQAHEKVVRKFKHKGQIKRTIIDYHKLVVVPVTIFGWQPGWLSLYILCSIIFSLGLRKLMKIA